MFDAAAKFAPAVGVPLIGFMLLRLGWRWSFAATGAVSLLYFWLFWKTYRDPEDAVVQQTALAEEESHALLEPRSTSQPASLWYLMRQKKVIGLALGFGSYNYVFYLLLTWLPSYLSAALHIDLGHSFLYTGVPWLFATATDLVVGGWLVDWLISRGRDASLVRKTALVGGTAFGLGILGAVHTHSAVQALLWISISIGGLAAAAPVGWSVPSLIAPRGSVGRVGGILNFSNQLSGIAAPIITGYLVSATRSFGWAFGVSAIYLLVGIAAYIFLLGRIEPIPAQAAL
jgi:MFS family permease